MLLVVAIALVLTSNRRLLLGAATFGLALFNPFVAVGFLAAWLLAFQIRRVGQMREQSATENDDALLAVELVVLGVTAGLPFRNAASLTAGQIGGPVAGELSRALRSISSGQQPEPKTSDIHAMFAVAAVSESSGMPLAGMLNALASDRRRAAAADAKERLAKLPVKMLFPLAFLILPGFVLLAVVPPLMSGLSKLGI